MKNKILLLLLFIFSFSALANDYKAALDSVSSLFGKDNEKAKTHLLDLKSSYDSKGNSYWLSKSNYFLGYLYRENQEFGKAIIHYLEAIRYAEKGGFESAEKDIISIHNRCGIIFRKFKAFELSEKYYDKGILMASEGEYNDLLILLKYNYAGLLRETDQLKKAKNVLSSTIPALEKGSDDYFDFKNRLALTHYDMGQFDKAIVIYNEIAAEVSPSNYLLGYSYHNLAKAYKAISDFNNSEKFYLLAIEVKKNKESYSSLYGYAELMIKVGRIEESLKYFKLANILVNEKDPESFKIYKVQADLHYKLENYELAKKYEDLYSKNLNDFLLIQQELQEIDRQLNLNLITKRYFDEVSKQERIASILLYSRLISGSLLILLLTSIGYNQYEKIRVRKNIEKQLSQLEMLD